MLNIIEEGADIIIELESREIARFQDHADVKAYLSELEFEVGVARMNYVEHWGSSYED